MPYTKTSEIPEAIKKYSPVIQRQITKENIGKRGMRNMLYKTNSELPITIQKYSTKVKSQWRHVFNTVYKKTGSETRAFKASNSILKKRFKKSNTYSSADYINQLVDSWLGNLPG